MTSKYDAIVIGMGPGAVFFAYEMIQKDKGKKILLVEQGKRVENRKCPIETIGKCVKCKPFCDITSGFSGAGAFSDGKLSLYNEEDDDFYVGGELHKYVGVEETKRLIDYTDNIYLEFGADPKLKGTEHKKEVNEIKKKAKKEEITLIDIPIRHLGTEKAHELYKKLENYLEDNNIDYQSFMSNSSDSQKLFLEMLDEAEEQIGFTTKDYKLMIEALATLNGDFIITVTRFLPDLDISPTYNKKTVKVKRKTNTLINDSIIYEFNNND